MQVRTHSTLLLLAATLVGAGGCTLSSSGGGGGGGGGGGDGGPSADARPRADAFPPDNTLCKTDYTVSGDVTHSVVPAGSCDGSGTWAISAATPVADNDYDACGDASTGEDFQFDVAKDGTSYTATDLVDGARAWTVQVHDKGGSCAATFMYDFGNGTTWSLVPNETGADGPLMGKASWTEVQL
jgi:hypothetical protein